MVGSDVTRSPQRHLGASPLWRGCFIPHHGCMKDRELGYRRTALTPAARAAFSLATFTIILAGCIEVVRGGRVEGRGDFNAVFFKLLALLLLPTVIYAIGVRRPESVLYFGLALLLITAFGWVFVFVTDEGLRAVFTPLSFLATLATSTAGVIRDRV